MKTRTTRNTPQPAESGPTTKLSRRKFLKGGLAAAATASAAASVGLPAAGLAQPEGPTGSGQDVATEQTLVRGGLPGQGRGNRPNILIILCDQMRYPPSYESGPDPDDPNKPNTKQFREANLQFQNTLREKGLDFQRHYVMSAACVPSRASIVTGHYPSLHGVSQTVGAAKEPYDPDVFWLAPRSVPTFGQYFRAAGYLTFWVGKWHASAAEMLIPGTHTKLLSYLDYDSEYQEGQGPGTRDLAIEALYKAANQLDPYGFAGWIGPEPHGSSALDSGSSVPATDANGNPERGRDVSFAEQATELIQELDAHPKSAPWLVVCSFTNPHDISCWGLLEQNKQSGFEFNIEPFDSTKNPVPVPAAEDLFTSDFKKTFVDDDLSTKPSCQWSYREKYHLFMQPILEIGEYHRYYYQLHKNVDQQMKTVFDALQATQHYKDNTIVVFTSDHGELLSAHGDMHQKFYQAYEETVHVPLMVWYPSLISKGDVQALTSHADLVPTLLGLAGIDPEPIRQKLAVNHSDAVPFVGRNLSPLILGQVDEASVNDPVYFMTDDDVDRGLHMTRRVGVDYHPVIQPNHVETVIARLDDGHLWKFSRYFDNTQYWSSPGTPSDVESETVEDVLRVQTDTDPAPGDDQPKMIPFETTAKFWPVHEEFEMYDLDADPIEVDNKYGDTEYSAQQQQLEQALAEQRSEKRLTPCSGTVLGQECNRWQGCDQKCSQ